MTKLRCDLLEKSEAEKYKKERNEKIKLKTENLSSKQNLEKNGLSQKLSQEMENMKKQKENEISQINLKYKNSKMDLEIKQTQEKNLSVNENKSKASKKINYKF